MDAAPSPVPSIERLLAERAWVRAFARSLVSDEASADDLEQQAWVAALEAPPAARRLSPGLVRDRAASCGVEGAPVGGPGRAARAGRRAPRGRRGHGRRRRAGRARAPRRGGGPRARRAVPHHGAPALVRGPAAARDRRANGRPRRDRPFPRAARPRAPARRPRPRPRRPPQRVGGGAARTRAGRRARRQRAVEVGGVGPEEGPTWGGRGRALPVAAGIALRGGRRRPCSGARLPGKRPRTPSLPPLAAATAALDAGTRLPASPVRRSRARAFASPVPAAAAPPEEPRPCPPADPRPPPPTVTPADGTVIVEVEVVEAGVTPDRWVEGAGLTWTCSRRGAGAAAGRDRVPGVVMFGVPPFTVWVTAPGYVARRLVDVGAVAYAARGALARDAGPGAFPRRGRAAAPDRRGAGAICAVVVAAEGERHPRRSRPPPWASRCSVRTALRAGGSSRASCCSTRRNLGCATRSGPAGGRSRSRGPTCGPRTSSVSRPPTARSASRCACPRRARSASTSSRRRPGRRFPAPK